MIILLLCEPRSGSTNLANWFNSNKKIFTVLINPDLSSSFNSSITQLKYVYKTNHLVIKEDYYTGKKLF